MVREVLRGVTEEEVACLALEGRHASLLTQTPLDA